MADESTRVAIIGCGRLGQIYAEAYTAYPDTEIVAIAEYNPERRAIVGDRFGVKALYPDADALFGDIVPDVASVVLPVRHAKNAVIAAAQAGVKGVSTEKPFAATLSDADEMVEACSSRGIVFSGGSLQRAMDEVQEAASWIRAGKFGEMTGASVHRWGDGEISGGGCQHISVLRLFTGAEVSEVIAWGKPQEFLESDTDTGLIVNGRFKMTNGMEVPVFGEDTPYIGVDIWSEDALVRWDWAPPEIYQGFDDSGARVRIEAEYKPYQWDRFWYTTGALRSFLDSVRTGSELRISGHDLRQALEVAIAAKVSAVSRNVPVRLPLEDRSLTLYPRDYRWQGGDVSGEVQTAEEAAAAWVPKPRPTPASP